MTRMTAVLIRSDKLLIFGGLAICVVAGLSHYGGWPHLVGFVVSALAVTVLASLVGLAVDQLGDRFGPGATGVLQSALGDCRSCSSASSRSRPDWSMWCAPRSWVPSWPTCCWCWGWPSWSVD
ncbi:hypothetical protein [Mycolicibacterium sp. GESEQ-9]|uniref:hypothetical protein n=1 Tax=Mycolicibacterium sp. GESEQ-9 TaxID=2812656 RepID=UPI001FF0A631|nr:hypothetical protein [Mycolicibacterium sp. GESEQ-9]